MQLEWKRGKPAGNVDRWQIIHFEAPSTIAIDVGVAPDRHRRAGGRPLAGRQRLRAQHDDARRPSAPATTSGPSSATTSSTTSAITTLIRDGVSGVFAEDEEVLAAQQRAIDEHPDKEFYNLNIDGGAMWARRLIDQMIAEEADDHATADSAAEREQDGHHHARRGDRGRRRAARVN